MRRAAKVDANQGDVKKALQRIGATVQVLPVGDGVPDLLVGWRGINFLLEVKDGNKPPSAQKLRPRQVEWHEGWKGTVHVVNSPEAALAAVGAIQIAGTIE